MQIKDENGGRWKKPKKTVVIAIWFSILFLGFSTIVLEWTFGSWISLFSIFVFHPRSVPRKTTTRDKLGGERARASISRATKLPPWKTSSMVPRSVATWFSHVKFITSSATWNNCHTNDAPIKVSWAINKFSSSKLTGIRRAVTDASLDFVFTHVRCFKTILWN